MVKEGALLMERRIKEEKIKREEGDHYKTVDRRDVREKAKL